MKKIVSSIILLFVFTLSINANTSLNTFLPNCFEAADASTQTFAIQTNASWEEEHAHFERIYDLCTDGKPYEMTVSPNN